MSFAVIRTGGKQYRVKEGDSLRVEKLEAEVGQEVELGDVLMVAREGAPILEAKQLAGKAVKATVVRHGRGPKIRIFKFKRRKGFEKRQGHRQDFTEIKISSLP
jgi:large subunit ribosomal protein L21